MARNSIRNDKKPLFTHIHVFFGKMSFIFNWAIFLLQENLNELFDQPSRIYHSFPLVSTVVELFCSKTFSSPQQKPRTNNHCSTLTLHSAPGHTDLLFVSMDLPDMEFLFKWNHTKCGLLCLASVTEHIVLKICPWCRVCQNSIPFHGWIIFHPVDRPRAVYPFFHW